MCAKLGRDALRTRRVGELPHGLALWAPWAVSARECMHVQGRTGQDMVTCRRRAHCGPCVPCGACTGCRQIGPAVVAARCYGDAAAAAAAAALTSSGGGR
jgi:hypothetical protein